MVAAFTAFEQYDTGLGFSMTGLFVFMVLILVGLYFDWDNRRMDAASEFFKTREKVYACEGLSPEVCKYKKLIWQKDSTIWQTRLNEIISK